MFVGESSNHRDFNLKDKYAVKAKAAENVSKKYFNFLFKAFFSVPSYIGQYNSQSAVAYKQHEPVCIK